MKGLETMPLRYVVITIILLIVVGVGFWQVNTFMTFKTEKDFKEDIVGIEQKISFLKSGGDFRSVVNEQIGIPADYEFEVDVDNDILRGNLTGEIYEVGLDVNITKVKLGGGEEDVKEVGNVSFPTGLVKVSLYYGGLENRMVKDYMIVFED